MWGCFGFVFYWMPNLLMSASISLISLKVCLNCISSVHGDVSLRNRWFTSKYCPVNLSQSNPKPEASGSFYSQSFKGIVHTKKLFSLTLFPYQYAVFCIYKKCNTELDWFEDEFEVTELKFCMNSPLKLKWACSWMNLSFFSFFFVSWGSHLS